MGKYKRLKDPIYGYIKVDRNILEKVVDTASFQRLRNVIQTSYSPVYASAVHNRFVHSLGVYHLGKVVTETLREAGTECQKLGSIDRWLELFEIACLLHDVGHAPFSHTGEEFYLEKGERTKLHDLIIKLTKDGLLESEIKKNTKDYKAAPHELMSIIVSLKVFSGLFHNNEERSFFARCISGYQYTDAVENEGHSFLNCLISFLNSDVIDVDKLDYLIRDSYITGFDTMSIDYERLLSNVRIRKSVDGTYVIAYKKGAISVIENVVYAHDAERKWIQNHPIVRYEAYLQQKAIEAVIHKYGESLFSYDYLSEEGKSISEGWKVSLLSDVDILFLMKNIEEKVVHEYFSRVARRHPVWKSESEYRASFEKSLSAEALAEFEDSLEDLRKYLNYLVKAEEINEKALEACKKDINDTEVMLKESGEESYEQVLCSKRKRLEWMTILYEFSVSEGIEFDYVVLQGKPFNSGFSKEALSRLQIEFTGFKKTQDFGKVTNVLKAEKSTRDKMFFLYYRRPEKEKNIDWGKLIANLVMLATRESVANR